MTMLSFVSTVMADAPAAAAPQVGFDIKSLLPFVLIIVIFYFFILRPQQKRMKQQREMLSNLRRGDKVVAAGGIMGTIHRIENERELHIEIAPNVVVKVSRASVSDVLSKTEPSSGSTAAVSEKPAKISETPVKELSKKAVAKPSSEKAGSAKPSAKVMPMKKVASSTKSKAPKK